MSEPQAQALDCEVVTTSGGARAVRDRISGEVMHPGVGPVVEAAQLYVAASHLEQRLTTTEPDALVLLDVGLGAGSNALAALRVAEAMTEPARRLGVVSFDRSASALALSLEHAPDFGFDAQLVQRGRELLQTSVSNTARSQWRFVRGELWGTLCAEPEASADVVYWDPFSPRNNPELWSVAAFTALRRLCRPGVTVHTYSGATSTRAALLLAGFAVGFGPAAGDKQTTTTVAALDPGQLDAPLDARWLKRFGRSSAPLPADAPKDARERIAALPQLA